MTSGLARSRAEAALTRLADVDRPEVWISLAGFPALLAEADAIDARVAAGEELALAGTIVAVKDNIDVAGFDTTAGSPGASYRPDVDAEAVRLLRAAGALVLGKTNLDQFATGLVGSRTPYGAVRAAHDETLVSGGSSAGSAVAVALGIVDAALGTDTAGSGRVPAAFNGIIGVKPTLGLVSTRGVVPASPSYDAVTVFAADLGTAERMLAVIAAVDPADPASRPWSPTASLAVAGAPTFGVPVPAALAPMSPQWRAAFDATVAAARERGATIVEVDLAPLLDVARLLYGGALVAERTAAFGHLLDAGAETVDPTVRTIVAAGADKRATDLVHDQLRLRAERARLAPLWQTIDALLLPTAPGHPSLAEVAADPIGVNAWVGTYTNFVNLLDLAAVAVPGEAPVGVTLIGPAHSDRVLLDLAREFVGQPTTAAALVGERPSEWLPEAVPLAVFGAHMAGEPLNAQLTDRGARLLGPVATASAYRFYALSTTPPKPGLVHVGPDGDAVSVRGELWAVPTGRIGEFLGDLVAPMTIGRVTLDDGSDVLGFLCEPGALEGAADISRFGDWRSFRGSLTVTR